MRFNFSTPSTTLLINVVRLVLLLSVGIPIAATHAAPSPVHLPLSKKSSSIKFGVNSPSPTLQMNGSFTKFQGSLLLDQEDFTRSKVNLALDLRSAQLLPDQILQAVFLQTAIAHLKQPEATFTSERIEKLHKGRLYLIHGRYTWQGKSKNTAVPIEIIRASSYLSEFKVALSGKAKEGDTPRELQQLGGLSAEGASGWAKATFIFAPKG